MDKKGILISLEGGEGSGKSTQARKLKRYLENLGYKVDIVQEPGQTRIGKKIREILLNPRYKEIGAITEVLLYMAARAQLVSEIIKPALAKGKTIICDRYIDSSMAYQGYGRELGCHTVGQLNNISIQGYKPDITIYFDLKPEVGLARKQTSSKGKMDRMETESYKFHRLIRKGYLELSKKEPRRIKVIPANQSTEDIWGSIKSEITKFLNFTI